ncbi:shikimate dehydrogenase [Xylophilus rhododendri]|uniref:Shikimate dehydrogenase (NADP(+)) n=1 Tax=Xylophilus rhododendri TaxID=2697032 RepID=A0A857J705_9BURK|nr:shikimate dehydrogenase [Xylophilus rhododendri]QHI99800.1 shikimate dehydrogenase [Xylophilus rhododendri]
MSADISSPSGADRYCVMGNPVAHSRSPWIHARFAELAGDLIHYGAQLVALDGFAEGVRAFSASGGRGCNVTVPFKFEAAAIADRLTDRARIAGAANTLRFEDGQIHADNTDGAGLVADIERNAGISIAGREVLLIGAGGASAGVLGPLLGAAPARLVVANRTAEKARALVDSHQALAHLADCLLQAQPIEALSGPFDIVINATASSLAGAAVPVPASVLRPGSLALDMMYGPSAAAFLAWARQHQAMPRDGLGMLVEQASEAFFHWRGIRPPSAQVLAELRALVDGGTA